MARGDACPAGLRTMMLTALLAAVAAGASVSAAASASHSEGVAMRREVRLDAQGEAEYLPPRRSRELTAEQRAAALRGMAQVHVEVYYETMCPYCVMFLNQTLAEIWKISELRGNLNVSLYPYGNAMAVPKKQLSDGYNFWHPEAKEFDFVHICQHGGDECLANAIQACVMKHTPAKSMEFVFCMAAGMVTMDSSVEKSSYDCLDQLVIDRTHIKQCALGEEGNELLTHYHTATDRVPNREGTPWVLVDGMHLRNESALLGTVCDTLAYVPGACASFVPPDEDFPVMLDKVGQSLPKHI